MSGWRILGIATAALIAAPLLMLSYVMSHDRDLNPIKAEAKRRGIALTWADVPRTPPTAGLIADRARLISLRKSVIFDAKGKPVAPPGGPVLPDLVAFHRAIPAATIDELRAIAGRWVADRGGDRPGTPGYGHQRMAHQALVSFLRQDFLACPREEAGTRAVAMLTVAVARDRDAFGWSLPLANAAAFNALRARLDDLASERLAIAEHLDAVAVHWHEDYRRGLRSLFAERLHFFEDPVEGRKAWGIMVPGIMESETGMRVVCRLGRAGALRQDLDGIAFVDGNRDPIALHAQAHREMLANGVDCPCGHHSETRFMPTDLVQGMIGGPLTRYAIMDAVSRNLLLVRILAAELTGRPWAIDPFSPTKEPLRAIERDGRIIGAYSLGENGVDNGGRSGDWVFPLYAPIDGKLPHNTAPGRK